MNESEEYSCSFCITSWLCDGPHMSSKKDKDNYLEHANYAKEDYIYDALDQIRKYSQETGLDLQELSDRIKRAIERRQI